MDCRPLKPGLGLSTAACIIAALAALNAGPAIAASVHGRVAPAATHISTLVPSAGARVRPLAGAVAEFAHERSWMAQGAKKSSLLYVSDYSSGTVDVFAYPSLTQVGTLTTLNRPQGICVDSAQNVWITDTGNSQLVEFAHGGTTPINTLPDPGFFPVGCSIEAKTGNLAVSNIETTAHGEPGDVAVFAGAKGSPTYYSPPGFYTVYFVGYDGKGDLFADGTNAEAGANGAFEFGELRKGGSGFSNVVPAGGPAIAFPGNVMWDGKHMTLGDQDNAIIYQLEGTRIIGNTPLTGSSDVVQYFIDGGTVVGPDAGDADLELYAYPVGGSPLQTIPGFQEPVGSAISTAK